MNEWRSVVRPATLAQVVGDIPDVHVISVRERRVTVDYPTIIQHNVNTDTIELDLDGEWDGMSVVLVLGPCGGAMELAWHGEPLTLPSALAEDTGGIDVSVVGYSADGDTRLVTVAAPSLLNVIKSGCTVGEAPAEETPDLIGQLLDAAADGVDMDAQLPGVEERLSSLELRVAALEAGTAPTEPSDEEWPEWVKPTSKDTMYNKDDKVSCDGRRFICRKNNVTTKPTEDSKSWEEQA